MKNNKEAEHALHNSGNDGEKIVFLHIGKTGGSYLKKALGIRALGKPSTKLSDPILYAGHNYNLGKLLKKFPKRKFGFTVRHPIAIFVSGFNSRQRKGRPLYNVGWSPLERLAFKTFDTPNALAEALSADDQRLRTCAEFAMLSIAHVKDCLKFYLHSPTVLEASIHRIAFIFRQDDLDKDLQEFIDKSGLSLGVGSLEVEALQERRHENPPSAPTSLSPTAEANLRNWYAKDIAIYEWCIENQRTINKNWLTDSAH